MDVSSLRTATLLGASSGLRTFSGPAALALHGRLGRGRARVAIVAAGAGELRVRQAAGRPGPHARERAGGAARHRKRCRATARRACRARRSAARPRSARVRRACTRAACSPRRLPVPDPVVGAAEDAIVLCLVALATRDRAPEAAADAAERAAARGGRVAAGVAATAVGTAAMTAAQAAAPADSSDAPGEVGRRLLEGVFGRKVRRRERGPLNHAMHWLYGTSWGVGLGLLTAGEAEPPPVVPTGLALGAGVWATSLVELPLLGLAPPVWRQPPAAIAADAGYHLSTASRPRRRSPGCGGGRIDQRWAWKRRSRSALPTTETLENTIARLATTGLRSPIAASGMAAMLYPNAQARFCLIVRSVARLRRMASLAARRSPETSVRSPASMATSVPVPIDRPRSACARSRTRATPRRRRIATRRGRAR